MCLSISSFQLSDESPNAIQAAAVAVVFIYICPAKSGTTAGTTSLKNK